MASYQSLFHSKLPMVFGYRSAAQASTDAPDDGRNGTELLDSQDRRSVRPPRRPWRMSVLSWMRWWLPEMFASLLSVASTISLIMLVRSYHGRPLQDLNLTSHLTLNGLVALLSTINRAALMVPIGSVMSQEVWLWLCQTRKGLPSHGQLGDLELSDAASRGTWGSFLFLLKARRR